MFIYPFCLISIYFQARRPLVFTSTAHYSLWYSSFSIVQRMGWASNVESRGKMRYAHSVRLQNMKGRDHLGDSETNGRITLQWILKGVRIDP